MVGSHVDVETRRLTLEQAGKDSVLTVLRIG